MRFQLERKTELTAKQEALIKYYIGQIGVNR